MPRPPRKPSGEAPLAAYAAKRNFTRTAEPPPLVSAERGGALRFVVQKHAASRLHYDFRLEWDGVLKSWAVPKGPSYDPGEKRLAVMVEDHPLDYGRFEGTIAKGEYGAGEVIVWDTGTYAPEDEQGRPEEDRQRGEALMRAGLARGKLAFRLRGAKLHGSWALVKMQRTEKEWLLLKHRDEFAQAEHDVLQDGRSVLSGASLADVRSGELLSPEAPLPGARQARFPGSLAPMLAGLATGPFDNPAWVFEPKLDGVRCLAFAGENGVRLLSRRGLDMTGQYPSLVACLRADLPEPAVVDGEIVALDEEGRPSFQRLQERLNLSRGADIRAAELQVPVVYYVFDLLYQGGSDLRGSPLWARRRRLLSLAARWQHLRLVEQVEEDGRLAYEAALHLGFEGLIAKRRDSLYEAGKRSQSWLKIKGTSADDFIIAGFTAGTGNRKSTFGALALAYYQDGGRLAYAGNVGTGFDTATLRALKADLDGLRTDTCPFPDIPEMLAPAVWVRPELVAQVKYAGWTRDRKLRAAVFLGLRPDKPARDVRLQRPVAPDGRPEGRGGTAEQWNRESSNVAQQPSAVSSPRPSALGPQSSPPVAAVLEQLAAPRDRILLECEGYKLPLTNLDKPLWPAYEGRAPITKRDLVRYYAEVAPYLLPHLRDRPLTLLRYPNGIQGQKFYQRHWDQGNPPPFLHTVRIFSGHNEGDRDFLVCNNLATLLWLGQLADLELHVWPVRVSPEPDAHHLSTTMHGSLEAVEGSLANYPDYLVFDLDPYIYSGREKKGEEPELNREAFQRVCEVALWLKDLFEQLGMVSFVKTTGKTGLHLFVPIVRRWPYDEVHAFAKAFLGYLVQQHPDAVTVDWATQKRTGKVFLDYNQNSRSKSLAAIFSPRAVAEAAVSTPLRWEEVGSVYPTDFTIHNMTRRLAEVGDTWRDALEVRQELPHAR